ncbi:FAD:protein FMN transferase [Mycobacterium sp. 3519A]|uniref:FAD:protein FMN transferase n=1 Tax=Mycobacterium sp. 3519A TaxID=2057184 RepID=UPI000C7E0ED9|nr:FAD:protein FMN transferase [Mycobacterium sp. 3519A]
MTVAEGLATAEWQRWSTDMQVVVTDSPSLLAARREVDAELDAIEAAASRFRPDSEINTLATTAGKPTEISELLADLLDASLSAARLTDGDVDPTVGAALIELGYDRDFDALADNRPLADPMTTAPTWSMVALHDRMVTVPPGVVLDLGATAKAVAADRCARRVLSATGCGVLINLGGDIATAGTAPEDGWQILVEDGDGEPASAIALPAGAAVATSSTLHRRWRHGGKPVHHILDPRTGRSSTPVWRTVSVAAQSCFAANTVSTAAVVRGLRAPEWIAALGMPARLVDSDMLVRTMGGWPDEGPAARS